VNDIFQDSTGISRAFVIGERPRSQAAEDGRNPGPPWMVGNHRKPINNRVNHLSTGAGFLSSTVCFDDPNVF
jgi:hypothetical protein